MVQEVENNGGEKKKKTEENWRSGGGATGGGAVAGSSGPGMEDEMHGRETLVHGSTRETMNSE